MDKTTHEAITRLEAAIALIDASDESEGNPERVDQARELIGTTVTLLAGPHGEDLLDFWNPEGVLIEYAINAQRAAYLLELDVHDVEWAMEEAGRCDSQHGTVVWLGQAWSKWEDLPPG